MKNTCNVLENSSAYHPFGMLMPERSVGSANYRYLYNGMEVDNEVSGNGNSYTTEFRQYDPRLGRWKSLDPLMGIQPFQSPYQAFNNNPIYFTDPLGLIGGPFEGSIFNTSDLDADKFIFVMIFKQSELDSKFEGVTNTFGTFIVVTATDIEIAVDKVTSMLDDGEEIQVLIIMAHGGHIGNEGRTAIYLSPEGEKIGEKIITASDIENFSKGNLNYNSEQSNNDIIALKKIMNYVVSDGDIIFYSCNLGDDAQVSVNLPKLIDAENKDKPDIYLNTNKCTIGTVGECELNPQNSNRTITTDENFIDKRGWVIIREGKPTFLNQKTENSTGRIKINYNTKNNEKIIETESKPKY